MEWNILNTFTKVNVMIEERDASLQDIKDLANNLRKEDEREVRTLTQEDPVKSLIRGFVVSKMCKVVFLNKKLVLIYGVAKTSDPEIGSPYMLATNELPKIGVRFVGNSKDRIDKMHEHYPVLFNYIDSRNKLHLKWLKWCGFEIIGFKIFNNVKFYRFIKEKKIYV